MNTMSKLIGRGMRFPFVPNESKGVEHSEMIDRINQSLMILFDTPKGSRLMLPDFGCSIMMYRFEPNDSILRDRLREEISEAIRKWEPRITVIKISFLADPTIIDNNMLFIKINYRIINTETEGNFVYPYMRETYDSLNAE